MRLFTRKVVVGTVGLTMVAGFAGGYAYSSANWSSTKEYVKELSAKEFNACQDQAVVQASLGKGNIRTARSNQSSPYSLTFFRLLGCPYCAKVEWLMLFYGIPFEQVIVDPINGNGLRDPRYRLAPQLGITNRSKVSPSDDDVAASPNRMPDALLVDSAFIESVLATGVGIGNQLEDKRITETRELISSRYDAMTFAAINSSWKCSFDSYAYLAPECYQNLVYRVIGSTVLYAISKYKITPRLLERIQAADAKTEVADATQTEKPKLKITAAEWLESDLQRFAARIPPKAAFHGGKTPDLADIEMFGVTRVVDRHPTLSSVLKSGRFGEWHQAMKAHVESVVGVPSVPSAP